LVEERIEALIARADTVVFVLSPDAVASEVAQREVAHAASLNKRFAPIVCRRTDDIAIPEPLRRLNFIFFDDAAQFEASADRLAEALQTDIGWVTPSQTVWRNQIPAMPTCGCSDAED
jgi:TIR domain